MDLSFLIEGLDELQTATREVRSAVEAELKVALYAAAKTVEGEAKRSIAAGGKTGTVYKRRTVSHRASAPGEAPASDTGALVERGINAHPATNALESTVVAGAGGVRYAAMLEFGTRRIAPRPFLFPALETSRDWIKERLARAVAAALK